MNKPGKHFISFLLHSSQGLFFSGLNILNIKTLFWESAGRCSLDFHVWAMVAFNSSSALTFKQLKWFLFFLEIFFKRPLYKNSPTQPFIPVTDVMLLHSYHIWMLLGKQTTTKLFHQEWVCLFVYIRFLGYNWCLCILIYGALRREWTLASKRRYLWATLLGVRCLLQVRPIPAPW